jgi:hypothetical protein
VLTVAFGEPVPFLLFTYRAALLAAVVRARRIEVLIE